MVRENISRINRQKNRIAGKLAEEIGIPGLLAEILIKRGITSAQEGRRFLRPRLEYLSDPFLMPDIEQGVGRVIEAIVKKETICLYGDYDADGVTSLALIVKFFRQLDIDPITYIPTRRQGYGLHAEAIARLKEQGVRLLVCLDCGSANVNEVEYALGQGIDTIIIDHHELGDPYPPAHSLINPKRRDSRFPTRELAACGVAFFFLMALRRRLKRDGLLKHDINLKKELDIVAIGSMGDMVPVTNDNRILIKFGMDMMNKKPDTWLQSFHNKKLVSKGTINEFALNFVIIPRINAAGRMTTPELALQFLLSTETEESESLLASLHEANKKRQRAEEGVLREITEMADREDLRDRNAIVLFKEDWHIGVLGIVAQRIVERFRRPAIVITRTDGIWRGSGRGPGGLDLYGAVTSLGHLVNKCGGHRYACGLSIQEENLPFFASEFERIAGNAAITEEKEPPEIDALADFGDLTREFVKSIDLLAPFGVENPRPRLLLAPSRVTVRNRLMKMTDQNNRIWHGTLPAGIDMGVLANNESCLVIASPTFRTEMEEQFIHLNIKGVAPLESFSQYL